MGIHESPTPIHWNYFLAIEDDLLKLSRYLEPTKDNFGAYSLELARILQTAAAEVDVVAKQLCQRVKPGANTENLGHYREIITEAFPNQFAVSVVEIPRFGLTLTPWSNWSAGKRPLWWNAYNNVKHHRHTHFAEASLQNALNAVSGLFVLLLFFYQEEGQNGTLRPDPALFRIGAPFLVERTMWGNPGNAYSLLNPGPPSEPAAPAAVAPQG